MNANEIIQLQPGARVQVKFGNHGKQLAVVTSRRRNVGEYTTRYMGPTLMLSVRKYRANSNTWTKDVWVTAHEVTGRAAAHEWGGRTLIFRDGQWFPAGGAS